MREVTTPTNEEGRASRAPAEVFDQTPDYSDSRCVSRTRRLEQAAEVLLLLEFPLAGIERVAFGCIFERRLAQAYEGGHR